MILASIFYWLGVLCLFTTLAFIAFVAWDCHCQTVQERRRADLRRQWRAGLDRES